MRGRRVDGRVDLAYPGGVFKTDYILDLIEQCARMLLAAAGVKKAEEAEEELAQAVRTWTGLDLDLALQLSNETLLQLLGAGELGAEERVLLVGHAIAVKSLVMRKGGELPRALALQERAVGLIEEALNRRPELDSPQIQEVLEALFDEGGVDT